MDNVPELPNGIPLEPCPHGMLRAASNLPMHEVPSVTTGPNEEARELPPADRPAPEAVPQIGKVLEPKTKKSQVKESEWTQSDLTTLRKHASYCHEQRARAIQAAIESKSSKRYIKQLRDELQRDYDDCMEFNRAILVKCRIGTRKMQENEDWVKAIETRTETLLTQVAEHLKERDYEMASQVSSSTVLSTRKVQALDAQLELKRKEIQQKRELLALQEEEQKLNERLKATRIDEDVNGSLSEEIDWDDFEWKIEQLKRPSALKQAAPTAPLNELPKTFSFPLPNCPPASETNPTKPAQKPSIQ